MRISGEHGISDDYSIMRVKRANWGEMKGFSLEHGRGARIRTGDLLNPIQRFRRSVFFTIFEAKLPCLASFVFCHSDGQYTIYRLSSLNFNVLE